MGFGVTPSPHFFFLGLIMGTDFGTSRANISRASAAPRNANTRPRRAGGAGTPPSCCPPCWPCPRPEEPQKPPRKNGPEKPTLRNPHFTQNRRDFTRNGPDFTQNQPKKWPQKTHPEFALIVPKTAPNSPRISPIPAKRAKIHPKRTKILPVPPKTTPNSPKMVKIPPVPPQTAPI